MIGNSNPKDSVGTFTKRHPVQFPISRQGIQQHPTLLLNVLIANSPIAIVVLDARHCVQMCNPAFERLFLYSQAELKGANLDKLITTKDTRADAARITSRVLAEEIVHATDMRRRKDGTILEVELHGVPLILNGVLVGVYGLYQDVTESRQTERILRELSARLLRSQDEERRRIARELHDSTAQNLTALRMNLNRLRGWESSLDPKARNVLRDTIDLAGQCAREIRTLSYLLHPPQLDDMGLAPALRWYASGFTQRSGIRVDLKISSRLARLPREFEITLYRVVQESLMNVLRHSGSRDAKIEVAISPSDVVLEVRDRGHGIQKRGRGGELGSSLGVGIAGMAERLRQLGGQLAIESSREGTKVRAVLPLVTQEP